MLWLTWQMWILLALAFAGGMIAGWVARGQSDEAPEEEAGGTSQPPFAAMPAPAAKADPKPASAPEPRAETPPETKPRPEPPVSSSPSASAMSAPEPTPREHEDDLTIIKGLGPKAAAALKAAGVRRIEQIAEWSAEDVARFDEMITGRGRIDREEWVPQAKALIAAKG